MIDDFNGGCLATPDFSLQGPRVVRELKLVVAIRGKRGMIASDDGPELASHAVPCWAAEHKIEWHCIAPETRQIIKAWQICKRDAIWLPTIRVSEAVLFLELRAEFRQQWLFVLVVPQISQPVAIQLYGAFPPGVFDSDGRLRNRKTRQQLGTPVLHRALTEFQQNLPY
jgi:hypothetical protein